MSSEAQELLDLIRRIILLSLKGGDSFIKSQLKNRVEKHLEHNTSIEVGGEGEKPHLLSVVNV